MLVVKNPPANAGDKRDPGSIPGFKEVDVGKMALGIFILGKTKRLTIACRNTSVFSF